MYYWKVSTNCINALIIYAYLTKYMEIGLHQNSSLLAVVDCFLVYLNMRFGPFEF
jgi:hypothetical protein